MYSESEFDLKISMLLSGSVCSIVIENIAVVFFWNVPKKMELMLFKAVYFFLFFLSNYHVPENSVLC